MLAAGASSPVGARTMPDALSSAEGRKCVSCNSKLSANSRENVTFLISVAMLAGVTKMPFGAVWIKCVCTSGSTAPAPPCAYSACNLEIGCPPSEVTLGLFRTAGTSTWPKTRSRLAAEATTLISPRSELANSWEASPHRHFDKEVGLSAGTFGSPNRNAFAESLAVVEGCPRSSKIALAFFSIELRTSSSSRNFARGVSLIMGKPVSLDN
ncbi:hypothetical protein PD885_00439 [Xanthomonas fragariae]|uniref:Secreted protein n=1 Tax=Xanthomonas fragariae TaxID=48664 RepID=A0ABY1RKD1_9XANT|nr:hypothetical protein PD885_00439 [Xanthomonas fragariae]